MRRSRSTVSVVGGNGWSAYRSDSVISRIISHVSKPSDTRGSKYCAKPSLSRRCCNSDMKLLVEYQLQTRTMGKADDCE